MTPILGQSGKLYFETALACLRQTRTQYAARRRSWPQGLVVMLVDGAFQWTRGGEWKARGDISQEAMLADDWQVLVPDEYLAAELAKAPQQ